MQLTFERTTFQTSRLLEFFSEKELQMQIGFPKVQWPIALLKELLDNALDACESAGVLPDLAITVEPDALSIRDNGPGLPVETLERSLDYLIRVSDKAHYVSPSRGQLGNALKCLWAAPYVVRGEDGYVEVTTGGITHRIAVSLDRIGQQPELRHLTLPDGLVKNGTLIKLTWPEIAGFLAPEEDDSFYKSAVDLLLEYAAFNPHLQVSYQGPDLEGVIPRKATDWHKWRPHDPTSPHWYSVERLQALIAAYLTDERQGGRARTVRELVAEFHGLRGSVKPKRVLDAAELSRAYLHDLIDRDDVAVASVQALLAAMQRESRPVKPAALGILGAAHVHTTLVTPYRVEPKSVRYHKVEGVAADLPLVLELGCGFYGHDADGERQRTIVGVNWTPAFRAPFPALPRFLGEVRVDSFDPVVVVVHLAMPRPEFTDRGKSTLTLPMAIQTALEKGVASVTKHWKGLKRQSDRDERVRERAREHYLKQQQRQYLDIKQAAYQVMADAYAHASGALGMANARQVMYAARPQVLALTGGKCWKRSDYFTQTLLPNFIEAHQELASSWDVVFDDRGHLIEPHTRHRIGLGTVAVRGYIREWSADIASEVDPPTLEHRCPTRGPANRYTHALFIEKEGFYPLLDAARIAEHWDLAVMSTKGMSVTAARQLVEALSAQGVTVLVCHDFDKSGFSILHTLQSNTRRYRFKTRPKVIDLGLRLEDVHAMRLDREEVDYPGDKDPRVNLRQCGATEEECAFLVCRGADGRWTGDRVELNAMTSDQFIAWLERKLAEAGVRKVIPDQTGLANAYRRAVRQKRLEAAIEEALSDLDEDEEITIPDDLDGRIRAKLDGSEKAWDEVLREIILGG